MLHLIALRGVQTKGESIYRYIVIYQYTSVRRYTIHCFAGFAVCFAIVIKALLDGFDPYIYGLTYVLNVPHSSVPVLLTMQ